MLPVKIEETIASDMVIIDCTLQGNINQIRPRFRVREKYLLPGRPSFALAYK